MSDAPTHSPTPVSLVPPPWTSECMGAETAVPVEIFETRSPQTQVQTQATRHLTYTYWASDAGR